MRAVHSSRTAGPCKGGLAPLAEFLTPRKSAGDPGLDRLLADPGLGSTAKTVAVALVRHWAWSKDHCWPSDRTIAARVGRSVGHVQRCLRQLEAAGWVERERTDDVPNGRRIWLNWRRAGARPGQAPARTAPAAPARTEGVVIVNEPSEPVDGQGGGRPRPEPIPAVLCEAAQEPRGEAIVEPAGEIPLMAPPSPPGPAEAVSTPTPVGDPAGRRRAGLGVTELAAAVAATADPILARELARLTAPPPSPEPRPALLATPDLLARLPGRHDLVMEAARRLCVETGDEKSATLQTFEGMARAVASRVVPSGVLAGCRREALGPRSREKGKVLVASWKREAGAVPRGGGMG